MGNVAKKRLLLVDDHSIVREGVKALLMEMKEVVIVGEAQDGHEALDLLGKIEVDIIVLDINMPGMNGIELTRKIKQKFPEMKIIALSMLKDEYHIREILTAGALAYILKDSGKEELLRGIKAVAKGHSYFSQEASQVVMAELVGAKYKKSKPKSNLVYLTKREKDVLRLIIQECTNQEIANELNIGIRTVDTHRRNLIQKVGARNSVGLVKYALENELLED